MTGHSAAQAPATQRPVARLLRELGRFGEVTDDGAVVTVEVSAPQLPGAVRLAMQTVGARFADLFGAEANGEVLTLRTVIALDRDARYLIIATPVDGPTMPHLSQLAPGAFVEECELFEQFGLQPPERLLLNRLAVAPVSAPEHPRLQEHQAPTRDTHLPHTVAGQAFEFPVGPVQAAAVESLYYGLVTSGEEIVDLYLHTWHKYRGIERRLRGLTPTEALFLVERADGLSATSSAVAFATAVEAAQGMVIAGDVSRARAICLELERLYNHAQCAVALAKSTGLWIGQSQAELATELLLRLNAAVTGHRYLFGAVEIGATRALDLAALGELLPAAHRELRGVLDALLRTNSFMDRVEATGFITPEQCAQLGLVGPIARACGAAIDTRVDHSPPGMPTLDLTPPVRESGDCLGRLLVRSAEVDESARLLARLAADEPTGHPVAGPRRGWGLGASESCRGETLAWVQLDDDGRVARARLRTASRRNWRAFDDAVRSQNVFTDVPIIEASFWLTVAGRAL